MISMTERVLPNQRFLHPQVPQSQVVDCLADALTASFTPSEWALIRHQMGMPAFADTHAAMTDWIDDCLVDPDWQIAQQLLPLLLSRLEALLMTRRIDA